MSIRYLVKVKNMSIGSRIESFKCTAQIIPMQLIILKKIVT